METQSVPANFSNLFLCCCSCSRLSALFGAVELFKSSQMRPTVAVSIAEGTPTVRTFRDDENSVSTSQLLKPLSLLLFLLYVFCPFRSCRVDQKLPDASDGCGVRRGRYANRKHFQKWKCSPSAANFLNLFLCCCFCCMLFALFGAVELVKSSQMRQTVAVSVAEGIPTVRTFRDGNSVRQQPTS